MTRDGVTAQGDSGAPVCDLVAGSLSEFWLCVSCFQETKNHSTWEPGMHGRVRAGMSPLHAQASGHQKQVGNSELLWFLVWLRHYHFLQHPLSLEHPLLAEGVSAGLWPERKVAPERFPRATCRLDAAQNEAGPSLAFIQLRHSLDRGRARTQTWGSLSGIQHRCIQ